MKILDRYILISYLKTFVSVFVILMFIFLLQTIWLYISELAGKDLDVDIILRFLLYFSPKLIPLVLPLTILVTSLMVFGSFAEKYEFAAMKSTGISLQRAMRSVMIFIILLSVTTFYFANDVIPWSEYKSLNLRKNIAQLKPAVAVSEGQFNEIGDINIKVSKKSGDRDQFLEDVIIHKKTQGITGNKTVIKANEGELVSKEGTNTLSLILKDGNYYDEIQPRDPHKRNKKPFAKSYFETYTINIDLSEINAIDLDEEKEISNEKMFRINELRQEIDSMSTFYTSVIKNFPQTVYIRSGISTLNTGYKPETENAPEADNYLDLFTHEQKVQVADVALNSIHGTIQSISAQQYDAKIQEKRLNKFEIALHDKYAMAVACVILFFVGAPLGAIIRKGGMGLPMVVAIVLFLAYHFIGIFAKNSAENGTIHPFIGSWFSTFILFPLSIWLTYRATTDQGLFNANGIIRPIGRFFRRIFKIKDTAKDNLENIFEDLSININISENEIKELEQYNTNKLIDIVKNYEQYNYTKDYRIAALKILDKRGISQKQLSLQGNLMNKAYVEVKILLNKLKKDSKLTTYLYLVALLMPIAVSAGEFFLPPVIFLIIIVISLIASVLFHIYLYKSLSTIIKIEKITKNKSNNYSLLLLIVGFPFYLIIYFYIKQQIKETVIS